MGVRPGYKQTEVGVIPEDWALRNIDDLIEDRTILGHLDGNHGELYPRSSEFKDYGVPYIGANDFSDGFVSFERCKFLSKERASQFRKGVAQNGDVLFAHNATVGPVALLVTHYDSVILSTTATYFRCSEDKLSNIFVKYALQSPHFVKQYTSVMAQSTRFQVPITTQRKFRLVLPPLPEQRAIATALSDVDALIASQGRLIAKKRDIKQAAMQELLTGKRRLPGFSGEWEVKRLGEIGIFSKGKGIKKDDVENDGLPCIRYGEIYTHHNDYIRKFRSFIPQRVANESQQLKTGDLLFAGSGETSEEIGKCVAFLGSDEAYAGGDIVILSPTGQNSQYLGYLMNHASVAVQKARMGQGDAVVHISAKSLAQIEGQLPNHDEQTAIATILSDMDTEIAALEQKRDKTRLLKQGMMQELLTGRIRLV